MSRTTYFAPGVYVEEVPSAQQPIAGVGTSTAAFIGIVPDTIYIPVPNPDYDPVAAKTAMQLTILRGLQKDAEGKKDLARLADIKSKIQGSTDSLKQRLNQIDTDLKQANDDLPEAQKAEQDAQKALDQANDELAQAMAQPEPEQEEDKKKRTADIGQKKQALKKAQAAHTDAFQKLNKLTGPDGDIPRLEAEKAEVEGVLAGTAATTSSGATSSVEENDQTFEDAQVDEKWLAKSILRPYVIEKFDVVVDTCDTKLCTNFSEYTKRFGTFSAYESEAENASENPTKWRFNPIHPGHHALTHAVNGFFQNGGTRCYVARIRTIDELEKALDVFSSIDEVAIIAAPGLPKSADAWEPLMTYCEDVNRENVFAVLDSPLVANDGTTEDCDILNLDVPRPSKNAAYYFPHIEVLDPAKQIQDADPMRQVDAKYRGRTYVPPSGHIAGIYARTDVERGVHKAPANCVVRGAVEVKYYVSKPLQESLNPEGVNAIRIMNKAVTVWGARTLGGDRNGEWKYVNVRRLFLFLQESIDEGTQWIVFEPNDPALWGKIRLNVSAFLTNVWRSGALFGLTPEDAFYVKCDAETNPPEVRDLGQVITEIGVAIVRPAEFVVFRMTQSTGQLVR
jgi:phage tail sheath protein FI